MALVSHTDTTKDASHNDLRSSSYDGEGLVDFVASVVGDDCLKVEQSFGNGFVRLRVSEAERRQAKQDIRCVEDAVTELLRNARDAGATRVIVSSTRNGTRRMICVLDNGCGVPQDMRDRIFDARVTSKLDTMREDAWGVHGRGMALYSIAQNAELAHVARSQVGGGTSIETVFDCTRLTERSDQSTLPQIQRDESGVWSLTSSPHNIARAAAEFALTEQDTMTIVLASPSQAVATIRSGFFETACNTPSIFDDVAQAFAVPELLDASEALGLHLSERTAHRVLSGEIVPAPILVDMLRPEKPHTATSGAIDLTRDRRGLRIDKADLERLGSQTLEAFQDLARAYYLQSTGVPEVKVRGDSITITIDFKKTD